MSNIILVSQSPRRLSILRRFGINVSVGQHSVDESLFTHSSCKKLVELLAKKKLESYLSQSPNPEIPVLAADTLISFQGKNIGKPENRKACEIMLNKMSGKSHAVWTGLALYEPQNSKITIKSLKTTITFNSLSPAEIAWYLDQDEWSDAAAGYKIQEKGEVLIKRIHGSYSNVVGLPISLLYEMIPQLFQ